MLILSQAVQLIGLAGQTLKDPEDRRVVQVAIAVESSRLDEAGSRRTHWDRNANVASCGQHDAQVLVVQVDAEPRVEAAFEHVGRFLVQHRRAGQPSSENIYCGA